MSKKIDEELSPLGIYEPGMNWNSVEKIILERRAIRVFKDKPVPEGLIRRVLEAGRFAPTAGNSQSCKFIVVNSPEIIAEMEKDAVKFAKRVMRLLDFSQKKSRRFLARIVIKRKMNFLAPQPFGALQTIAAGKVPVFYHPPVMILLLTDVRGASNPHVDIGVIGQNMVLAAHSLGLGTCWIGMIKLILHPLNRKSRRKWRKFFDLKFPYELNEAICLGYPKGKYDGQVAREVQFVTWYEGGMKDAPRIENQGE